MRAEISNPSDGKGRVVVHLVLQRQELIQLLATLEMRQEGKQVADVLQLAPTPNVSWVISAEPDGAALMREGSNETGTNPRVGQARSLDLGDPSDQLVEVDPGPEAPAQRDHRPVQACAVSDVPELFPSNPGGGGTVLS